MKLLGKIAILSSIAMQMFSAANTVNAQELNARVNINYSSLSNTPTPVFQALQKDVTSFLNEHRWTNHTYDVNEKIECNVMITITDFNGVDKFTGTIQINQSRPVYYTSYNSPLLTFKESDNKLVFNYREGEPLEYVENHATSNLVQVLAYYANIILGYDYDTFSPLGGSEFSGRRCASPLHPRVRVWRAGLPPTTSKIHVTTLWTRCWTNVLKTSASVNTIITVSVSTQCQKTPTTPAAKCSTPSNTFNVPTAPSPIR